MTEIPVGPTPDTPFVEPSAAPDAPSDQAYQQYDAPGVDPGAPVQSQYWQQYQQPVGLQAPAATDVAPVRRRRALTGAIGAIALIAAFGIGIATGRATAPKTAPEASATSANPPHSANPAASNGARAGASQTSASSGSAAGTLETADLVKTLAPLPSGARSLTVAGAGPDGSMDLDQFMKVLFSSSPSERPLLQSRGFEGAASHWMTTSSGQEDCLYLVAFASAAGAQSYVLGQTEAHEDDPTHASDTKFSVPGLTDGVGFENAKLDSYGNADSWVLGSLGNVAVIVDSYTPANLARAEVLRLVGQQVARLSVAEKAV